MEDIIKQVADKANITEEQAKIAVELIVDILKDRLPAPLAGQIDGALSGEGSKGLGDKLGGLFGKK